MLDNYHYSFFNVKFGLAKTSTYCMRNAKYCILLSWDFIGKALTSIPGYIWGTVVYNAVYINR